MLGESVQDLDLGGISFGRYKELAESQSRIDYATYPWLVVWLIWLWIWAWSFRFRYFAMEILARAKCALLADDGLVITLFTCFDFG